MGQCIAGAIPIEFRTEKQLWMFETFCKSVPKNFLDFYDNTKTDDKYMYFKIKDIFILNHLKSFFIEFHSLIESVEYEKYLTRFDDEYENLVRHGDMDALLKHFDYSLPRYYQNMPSFFSPTAHMICNNYLMIYYGSDKAFLEEYTTLRDMGKLLGKAIDNPLKAIMIFGIFG